MSRNRLRIANCGLRIDSALKFAIRISQFAIVLSLFAANPRLSFQSDARQIVEEAQRRTRSGSQRYEGTLQVIDAKAKVTEKRWLFDRLGSHGDSKSILRFTAPAEVKGVAVLIVNHR